MNLLVSYTALEDSYFQSTGVRAPGFNTGTAVDLFASTSFLYSLAIMICVVTAGAMYMRAGLYRMQASESGVRKSNEEIKRVTFGLLGVLSLFVILYTFNKGLLTGTVSLDVLKTSGIVPGGGGVFGGGGATGDTGGTSTPTTTPSTPVTNGSEEANRAVLSAAGISVNNAACASASSRGCTNVGNINPATMAMLLKLKSECNCTVFITGGSEPNGHSATSNHGPGKEAVDLRYEDQLGNFLKSKSIVANAPPCNVKYGYSGFIFWDEAAGCTSASSTRHFHASFTGR